MPQAVRLRDTTVSFLSVYDTCGLPFVITPYTNHYTSKRNCIILTPALKEYPRIAERWISLFTGGAYKTLHFPYEADPYQSIEYFILEY